MPSRAVKDAILDRDLVSTVEKPVKEPIHYAASSALSSTFHDILDEYTFNASLDFDQNIILKPTSRHKRSKSYLIHLRKKAEAIVKFFQNSVFNLQFKTRTT